MPLTIAVFSDVICPWCYLGKHRLERALDQLGMRETTSVEWLPFELNPDMPAGGMERALYRARKFGTERSAQLDVQMAELGRQEGISFAFERMLRTPNTRRAHTLIAFATQHGHAGAVVDALFRAYFEEGRDVGELDVLLEVGLAAGLDRAPVVAALSSQQLVQHVEDVERQAAHMKITGVPFFILDRKWTVSGAQSTEQWLEILGASKFVRPADHWGAAHLMPDLRPNQRFSIGSDFMLPRSSKFI